MHLRSADTGDTETVLHILTSSRSEYLPYAKSPHSLDESRSWVSHILIPSGGVVVAQLDNEDVGVLATSISNPVGWIDQLYVLPGFLRKGIGTELLSHALRILPRPIHLWTFQQNYRAISFYERYGFRAIRYTDGETNEEKCPDILYQLN